MFPRWSNRISPPMIPRRRESVRGPRCSWSLATMRLEERVLLSGGGLNHAVSIPIGSSSAGGLAPGGAGLYEIQPDANGLLIAQAHAETDRLQLRLSLIDALGNLLVQSDGQSLGQTDPLIDQHVAAGTDYLEVQSLSGSGSFDVSTTLTPSSDPGQTLVLPPDLQEGNYAPIAVGDFTNNGILDIAAPDGVHLGLGDGTFQAPSPTGALVNPTQYSDPSAIVVGEFNGDQDLDVAVALAATDSLSISMGNGDGTFQPATTFGLPVGGSTSAMVAGDFGTGHVDLAVADSILDMVYIIQANGDGTFQLTDSVAVGQSPVAIAEGDFAGNGRTDLAVADLLSGDVTVLMNGGNGSFSALPPIAMPAGSTPTSIVAANFGTGNVNLAVTDSNLGEVDILEGDGDGTFQLGSSIAVGANPSAIVAGDLNGDGDTDLAVTDANNNEVGILLGNGNGTFQPALSMAAGTSPLALVAGDFNGDGRLDLATGNAGSNDISVLLGKGDGTFEEPVANAVGAAATALATGDFTGNNNLGLAVLNQGSDSVTILPGNGDGTFQQSSTVPLPAGSGATSVVAADFNDDGRLDLAVTDSNLDVVTILLGNGDGTFEPAVQYALQDVPTQGGVTAGEPYAIVAGDFTGNGIIDLAVADRDCSNGQGGVTILMGNGDGTFRVLPPILYGNPNDSPSPDAIVAGQFTGSDNLDLAVADTGTDDVTVFLNAGGGTFLSLAPIPLGNSAFTLIPNMTLVAGPFTDDGHDDLAVATTDYVNGDSVDVLLGNGDGTFTPVLTNQSLPTISLGNSTVLPIAIVVGHFTSSGNIDLATADSNGTETDDYSIYLGNGDGTFQAPVPYTLGGAGASTAIVAGYFTGDGRTDLAIARTDPDEVRVVLSDGDGTFSDPSEVNLASRDTPMVADLGGDGVLDVSVVDAAGDILYRAGRPGEPGSFAAPITVNPNDPSRDIAFVDTDLGPLIASVDAIDNAISFFALRSTGFVLVAKLGTGPEPAQILSADLDDDGVTDLIVRNAGDGTISTFQGDGDGWFLPGIAIPVGLGASDMTVGDLDQDGLLDLIVTNRLSGQVEVLRNLGGGNFASPVLYDAGPGPYGVTGTADPSPVSSLEGTTSVSVGAFTTGGLPSLVMLDPGSDTLGLLSGLGDGLLSNASIFPTPGNTLVVRAVNFNGDGLSGLAILTSEGLYIERSDGRGGFLPPTEIDVGFEPNGLTVADLNGDGKPDLLVSNPLGDVLVLFGNGNGTFQSVQNLDKHVALAVVGPAGNTPGAFIFSDEATDQVVVKTAGGVTTVLGSTSTGLVAPGAVKLADLNNDGVLDLIVADSGSNNVLVYPGLGNGTFGPSLNGGHGFFTGTNPVGITVADLTGDGRPDLIIANEGSNDVSILINVKVGNSFTFVQGPLLQAGVGPVATAVEDLGGGGPPDLLIADSGSNDVRLLRGLGNGFFDDLDPTIYPVGTDPSALIVGQFTGGSGQDLATVNSGSNSVTVISGVGTGVATTQSIPTGGIDPIAAFAVDFGGNGLDSLVVANDGDGNISLLTAGENGLTLSSVLSSPGLPNPSALALASFNSDGVEFFASTEGEESATLLGFQLEESAGGIPSLSSASSPGGATTEALVTLVSLNETSLSLVGTLLTITLNTQDQSELSAEGVAAEVGAGSSGASAGQGMKPAIDPLDEVDDEIDATQAQAAPQQAIPLFWARYVTGVDQALRGPSQRGGSTAPR